MKRATAALSAGAFKAWMHRSLGARIVVLSLSLLLAVQVVSFIAIRNSIDHNARTAIAEELEVGERVLRHVLDQNAQKLSEGATLLASDYGFRSALGSDDASTIASVLSNHGDRIGASVAILLDTGFHVRASGQSDMLPMRAVIARMASHANAARRNGEIALVDNKPFQFVMVPMRAPVVVGWVLMAFPIDPGLLNNMRDLSSIQVSLQVRDNVRAPWKTSLSTLAVDDTPEVERQTSARWTDVSMARPGAISLSLRNGEYTARAVLLNEEGSVSALLLRSVDEAVAPYRQLQWGLIALTLLSVVVIGSGSVLTARHVTTPIHKLVAAAERLGAGDYDTPLGGQHRRDELGTLAHSFERMRISIAGQQQEILKLAYWDSLTGLPNRIQFRNATQDAIAAARSRTGRSVAIVMLDLDRFKLVNDLLGYKFGDTMLKSVAERLSMQAVRAGDLVARLDGDEFAILLTDLDATGDMVLARSVAQRIGDAFGVPLTLEEQTVDMSASIGMAVWPHHAADTDTLLSRAEAAMYTAKRRAQSPTMYDPAHDAASTQTLSLLSELRHALGHGELRLYLQPKLALDTARVVGAEALVRWQHPQRGLVAPMDFIPFAEQTGFIRLLTLWVFEEAARLWKVLNSTGVNITFSVNLSTRDLLDPELPQSFEGLLVKHAVPAEAFCLEITESSIMDDPQRALATLDRLSGMGFRLSIDDFGTGYSSLAYLKRLPVDELKIDKSFVLNMENDEDDARIVRSTIDLAHGMGLMVVAEGVENAQVWDLLRELSCDEAQGFHMGRPMPAHEFARWSSGWTARHASVGAKPFGPDSTFTLH
jgi:diguanylate cyclase (GGDEF)-like protein